MLEIGQVLWLKIRFNNEGSISEYKHPYLILAINKTEINIIEIAQLDKIRGKEYKALFKSNKIVYKENETVINEDSFIQLDNQFLLENFEELDYYKTTEDKLSQPKLNDIINAYFKYHENNEIDDNKCVYMSKEEIIRLNS